MLAKPAPCFICSVTMVLWDVSVACAAVSSWIRGWSSSPYHVCGYVLLIYFWRSQGLTTLIRPKDDPIGDDFKKEASHRSRRPSHDSRRSANARVDGSFAYHAEEMWLREKVPSATDAERCRFLVAENGNVTKAQERLLNYVSWTTKHQRIQRNLKAYEKWTSNNESRIPGGSLSRDDEERIDCDDWHLACAAAMVARNEPTSPTRTRLPRIARTFCDCDATGVHRCREGYRIIHITPGKMDDRIVPLETYALAIALYMDRKLPRDSSELVTVMIDARGGVGWLNLHAAQLIPFIQHTSGLLLAMFPERLGRAIVYPVPWCLSWIWNVVKCCLDPKTSEKIHLLSGPAKVVSPPPHDQLVRYLTHELSNRIEAERIASFLEPIQESAVRT